MRQDVVPALQGMEGAPDVALTGMQSDVVTIVLGPAALVVAGLRPDAIALSGSGVVVPAGQVTSGSQSLGAEVGQPLDLAALRAVALSSPAPGAEPITLSDVADVEQALAGGLVSSTLFTLALVPVGVRAR